MKILLAEDDMNISVIAKMTLEQFGGHDVDTAHDGEEALSKALANSYDVILLDEMMPKMNGLKVCQEIKAQASSQPPIIFLSAKSQDQDVKLFNQYGLGHIPKPFDPSQLCTMIEQLLSSQEAAA